MKLPGLRDLPASLRRIVEEAEAKERDEAEAKALPPRLAKQLVELRKAHRAGSPELGRRIEAAEAAVHAAAEALTAARVAYAVARLAAFEAGIAFEYRERDILLGLSAISGERIAAYLAELDRMQAETRAYTPPSGGGFQDIETDARGKRWALTAVVSAHASWQARADGIIAAQAAAATLYELGLTGSELEAEIAKRIDAIPAIDERAVIERSRLPLPEGYEPVSRPGFVQRWRTQGDETAAPAPYDPAFLDHGAASTATAERHRPHEPATGPSLDMPDGDLPSADDLPPAWQNGRPQL